MTADASVISQITMRRSDFPKPLEVYGSLRLYGENVVTTEDQTWRAHRKISSPSFSEKNNHMVWAESIVQAQSMMDSWMKDSTSSSTITTLGEGSMRLSLHVISRAGFGQRLQWPKPNDKKDINEEAELVKSKANGAEIGRGHTMSYSDALSTLLENIVWVLIVPRPLLSMHLGYKSQRRMLTTSEWLPFSKAKLAHQAFVSWGMYLQEMYVAKRDEVVSSSQPEVGMDLMGALVKGGGFTGGRADPALLEKGEHIMPQLTEDDILGNAFIFILAGHETTANSIHFSMIYLAVHL